MEEWETLLHGKTNLATALMGMHSQCGTYAQAHSVTTLRSRKEM